MSKPSPKAPKSAALAALVWPLPPEKFLAELWPGKGFVHHGPLERFGEVAEIPELKDAAALIRAVKNASHPHVQAWFTDTNGRFAGVPIYAANAESFYGSGRMTIVVNDVGRVFPRISAFIARVAEELGTPQTDVQANAYISPPGIGTRMHFDRQESFFLQLHGSKNWAIAPNEQLKYPLENFVFEENPKPSAFPHEDFPVEMPESAVRAELAPGSVAFLPRGYWHESKASMRGSIHLTLTFSSLPWADLFLHSLRLRLMAQEKWRMPAANIADEGERGKSARAGFEGLKNDLIRQVTALRLDDLIDAVVE